MPNYGFICEGCAHSFDKLLSIKDRELPLNECCPQCGENKIQKDYGQMRQALASDTQLNANTATGGKWNELMSRMKGGLAKRYHQNLDSASANTGRSWPRLTFKQFINESSSGGSDHVTGPLEFNPEKEEYREVPIPDPTAPGGFRFQKIKTGKVSREYQLALANSPSETDRLNVDGVKPEETKFEPEEELKPVVSGGRFKEFAKKTSGQARIHNLTSGEHAGFFSLTPEAIRFANPYNMVKQPGRN